MLTIRDDHHAQFARMARAVSGWTGSVPSLWAEALAGYRHDSLSVLHVPRASLRGFCQRPEHSAEACFLTCMAWGGMRMSNGRSAWGARASWLPIVQRLREGGVTRRNAYDLFHRSNIDGLGAAYYTKLIHFMRPEDDGYILDQWSGKSISLMFEPRFIIIRKDGWVTRSNDADKYELYCNAVDQLSAIHSVSGAIMEEMMFSGHKPRKPKQAWRQYVMANWRP